MDKIKRERTGSFFTPQIWVELSQKYLTDVLGVNWQDEYYIWDCAAGTGNLLIGLTNKYNIFASTLDRQDIDVIKDRIKNGANLIENNVFQFDFLNDDFTKLPKELQDIINDPEKRKKLVVYINPPYAETNAKKGTESGVNIGKSGVNLTKLRDKYDAFLGKGKREVYAQFVVRLYNEIKDCKIAIFSKLKILNAPFYEGFRSKFLAKLQKMFVVPANSFDNVKGQFPIGFQIWDTSEKQKFEQNSANFYDKNGVLQGTKMFYSYENIKYVNSWIIEKRCKEGKTIIAKIFCVGSDFQHQDNCRLNSQDIPNQAGFTIIEVCVQNIVECTVFYAVRHCIEATWLNDRDQFLYPKNTWETDTEFHNDCLIYTLFSNNVQSKFGTNHWIPFTEYEVDSKKKFESNFMSRFISGKVKNDNENKSLIKIEKAIRNTPLIFSQEAKEVFEAGKNLWKYYHTQTFPVYEIETYNANASLYDIREYFQGRNESGKMNHKGKDETYTKLIGDLREKLKVLAKKIEPKVYEHGFLLE